MVSKPDLVSVSMSIRPVRAPRASRRPRVMRWRRTPIRKGGSTLPLTGLRRQGRSRRFTDLYETVCFLRSHHEETLFAVSRRAHGIVLSFTGRMVSTAFESFLQGSAAAVSAVGQVCHYSERQSPKDPLFSPALHCISPRMYRRR